MNNEYLCWINLIGEDIDGIFTYEFLFTSDPDTFWNDDFEVKPIGLCSNIEINEETYDLKRIVKTEIKLDLIQNNCCFSMQDCMDLIVAIAWENIDEYNEYPENGRLILNYADNYHKVEAKLAEKNILFEENGKQSNI